MPTVSPPPHSGFGAGGTTRAAARLWVRGVVQGVGFRPFVYGLARRHGLAGWVRNTSAGVQIHVEGPAAEVQAFAAALPEEAPPRSHIVSIDKADAEPVGEAAFRILESAVDPSAYQLVSPDIALCPDCRGELLDPADRRFGYPFTNCTNCGPRFTIIESLPYDRERTTMRHFTMCPQCATEYEDPEDRRFHAEPNACPVCGPRVWLLEAGETVAQGSATEPDAPIKHAAKLLRAGQIVAVKGLGGFHIACDATDRHAVERLKRRKRRPHKPLAVMFADVEQLRRHCRCSAEEEELLDSPEHPIVLLEWRRLDAHGEPLGEVGTDRDRGSMGDRDVALGAAAGRDACEGPISAEVAVRQRYLGAMLPYTPLHLLLLRAAARPLVMTSGNLAEEPIVTSWEEASRLAGIPDAHLLHDREICARYDDSVALVRRGRPRLVRRSRGYAPFPVALSRPLPQVLACGAELKNTFCMTRDTNAFLSQHIGDLENLETLEHFERSVELYTSLFGLQPEVVAYDLHPEYLATKYALGLPERFVRIGVQHHHAHVAACMAEHGADEPVIGVSMDGLGYGTDGTLWGGEVLVCDLTSFRRAAHLEYLPLAGGAAAVRRPRRTAAGWLLRLLGEDAVERARRVGLHIPDTELEAVRAQVAGGINAPLTSSCGRLFDAVAALTGLRDEVSYEGQAAIELEMVSSAGAESYPYAIEGEMGVAQASAAREMWPSPRTPSPAAGSSPALVRLAPLFAAVLDDLEGGATPGAVGSRLHATLAAVVLDLCRRVRAAGGPRTVVLSGGVFQNRLLTDLCEEALERAGFRVLTHELVPANDGGLSLGQAVIAGYTHLASIDTRVSSR